MPVALPPGRLNLAARPTRPVIAYREHDPTTYVGEYRALISIPFVLPTLKFMEELMPVCSVDGFAVCSLKNYLKSVA
jgi:hypothetical protein